MAARPKNELAHIGGSAAEFLVEGDGEVTAVQGEQWKTVDDAEDHVDDRKNQRDRRESDFVGLRTDLDDSNQADGTNVVIDLTSEDPTEQLAE